MMSFLDNDNVFWKDYITGEDLACGEMMQEGKPAIQEAIDFLRNQQPLHALEWSEGLAKAA